MKKRRLGGRTLSVGLILLLSAFGCDTPSDDSGGGGTSNADGSTGRGDASSGGASDGSAGSAMDGGNGPIDANHPPPFDGSLPMRTDTTGPRMIAYVNCLCGFGMTSSGTSTCLGEAGRNYVQEWESSGTSPITHYIISFLSFDGAEIRTDPGEIWESGGGSTTNFALHPNLRAALLAAQTGGKKIMLSLGGETGSREFVAWWQAQGSDTESRITRMRSRIVNAVMLFEAQNDGLFVDGIDVDIELGGGYPYGGEKYNSTRDLINAIPEEFVIGFVPQIGNGLCAAPASTDTMRNPLGPVDALGGQCMGPAMEGAPWTLTRLDQDCTRSDGSPRLNYFGIQYYNASTAVCCGGGSTVAEMQTSAMQNYRNLSNGWPAMTVEMLEDPSHPWNSTRWYPGPWPAYAGLGASRLVLGKPSCNGCAGSNYLDATQVTELLDSLDGTLNQTMGGMLFWDLCRLFGNTGGFCVGMSCQPSWAASPDTVRDSLQGFADRMQAMTRSTGS